MGLLDKINAASGKSWTKEEFLQDCLDRAGSAEVFEQSYNCNPSGSTSAIVSWTKIELCGRAYNDYERVHVEKKQINDIFGEYVDEYAIPRRNHIGSCSAAFFPNTVPGRRGIRSASMSPPAARAIWPASTSTGMSPRCSGSPRSSLAAPTTGTSSARSFTGFCATPRPYKAWGTRRGSAKTSAGTRPRNSPRHFTSVNFKGEKHNMGFALMNQLDIAEKQWPAKEKDIAADYFALRKFFHGGSWKFSEGTNALNKASHCDIAWGGRARHQSGNHGPPRRGRSSRFPPRQTFRAVERRNRSVSAMNALKCDMGRFDVPGPRRILRRVRPARPERFAEGLQSTPISGGDPVKTALKPPKGQTTARVRNAAPLVAPPAPTGSVSLVRLLRSANRWREQYNPLIGLNLVRARFLIGILHARRHGRPDVDDGRAVHGHRDSRSRPACADRAPHVRD